MRLKNVLMRWGIKVGLIIGSEDNNDDDVEDDVHLKE